MGPGLRKNMIIYKHDTWQNSGPPTMTMTMTMTNVYLLSDKFHIKTLATKLLTDIKTTNKQTAPLPVKNNSSLSQFVDSQLLAVESCNLPIFLKWISSMVMESAW